jgi:hypothetical protein
MEASTFNDEDEDYNPLKLRQGRGFGDDSQSSSLNDDPAKNRKINKMPFKVLDAP